jgi:hypothetical protein
MFEEIVVGVDEGEDGLDAIALAKTLAAPGARLELAHVIVGGPDFIARPATEYAADAASHSIEEFERTLAYQILEDALDRDEVRRAGFALELHCVLAASVEQGSTLWRRTSEQT